MVFDADVVALNAPPAVRVREPDVSVGAAGANPANCSEVLPGHPASPVPAAPLLFPDPLVACPSPYPPSPVLSPVLFELSAGPHEETQPLVMAPKLAEEPVVDAAHEEPPPPPPAENSDVVLNV